MSKQHELGQYFTTNNELKEKVFDFIQNNPARILEPSVGQGDLVDVVKKKNNNIVFDMYEIDDTINMLDGISKRDITYGDFMIQNINKKYDTIIGNPPFVRTTKGNLYIDFTKKCYELLENNGELIFIVPSDFFKLTCASNLLSEMMKNGTFTDIYHPHNEKLFTNASIDVIVYRYCKNSELSNRVMYNNKEMYIINSSGLITFSDNQMVEDNKLFKDYFNIYVGIVSGKDAVYKNSELGNISVLTGDNKYTSFIYVDKFPCENEEINIYLEKHKEELMNRKIRKFNETNWFEWGAPRNIKTIEKQIGIECIYIYNLTRNTSVAFKGVVNYFGGNLLIMIPKQKCDLDMIVSYINSLEFKSNFQYSGRFKIGHRQLSNSYIPNKFFE